MLVMPIAIVLSVVDVSSDRCYYDIKVTIATGQLMPTTIVKRVSLL
jgi:hypothetical protein